MKPRFAAVSVLISMVLNYASPASRQLPWCESIFDDGDLDLCVALTILYVDVKMTPLVPISRPDVDRLFLGDQAQSAEVGAFCCLSRLLRKPHESRCTRRHPSPWPYPDSDSPSKRRQY
jgi:hypothetical protein